MPKIRIKMKNSKIKSIKAREILDSRGNPTVEAEVETDAGVFFASVPSGASTGKREATELRDKGKRYQGKGVLKAVRNVNKIIGPKLKGKDAAKQKEIDELLIKLDGTKNKSRLGANAILAVSIAACRTSAAAKNIPLYQHIKEVYQEAGREVRRGQASVKLPFPCFNVINGGAHAGNDLDFQEFMIAPQFKKFSKNLQAASEIYHTLKQILQKKFGKSAINIGDEGGFAPPIRFPEQALDLIMEAIGKAGYANRVKIVLDVAASQFYLPPHQKFGSGGSNGKYKTKFKVFSQKGLVNYYLDLIKKYPIIALEDPFSEDDWKGWKELSSKFKVQSSKLLIIGDDLLCTNPKRIREAHEKNACNGLLLKPNQIGTVTEAIEATKIARSFGWKIMVSHRSGETNDDFIADLAVGISADFIKAGAPARGERLAKYNRLLRIEEEMRSANENF